jgi:exopolysaccharide/PEP-CTERM locus tyrosine autokinase
VSIIEQAARRLEELRRSGIEVPQRPENRAAGSGADARIPSHVARLLDETRPAAAPDAADPASTTVREISARPARASLGTQSKAAHIDLERLAAMGYITPEIGRAQLADEFRVIKRPLLMNVQGKSASPVERANLIMITSSMPGEGKTFVAINLAMSIAMELDKTVLLVDADVSRPSVLSRLGLSTSPGLLDLLTDAELQVSDVLLRTNIDGLSLLPSGSPRREATELLASEGMVRLIDDLASRYADRILVFDAPPLLVSTESRVLATHMGQIVAVVEAERTPEKTVAQALATIESCPVVMPLLNKTSQPEVGSYYGYYGPVDH